VARFLGVPVSTLHASETSLKPVAAMGAQLRKVKNVEQDRLSAAIHAGVRIAEAVVRNLREPRKCVSIPPREALSWASSLRSRYGKINLETIAADLWARGIAVVLAEQLPSPKFQGLACIAAGRPAIVLGHSHDAPARIAFFIAHESAHVAFGDCEPEAPVVDEDDELLDTSEMERRADAYAWASLVAGTELPDLEGKIHWKDVARRAEALGAEREVDAGVLVWSWANRTRRFDDGQMALRALYLARGGRHVLRSLLLEHLDIEGASETDQALLACARGDAGQDAPAC